MTTAPACCSWPLPEAIVGGHYAALVRWHDGRCGICGKPETARKYRGGAPRGLSEDHDHAAISAALGMGDDDLCTCDLDDDFRCVEHDGMEA